MDKCLFNNTHLSIQNDQLTAVYLLIEAQAATSAGIA
jgi:hypothetical protein